MTTFDDYPKCANDWRIFDSVGSGKAARSMTSDIKKAFKLFDKLMKEGVGIPRALNQADEFHSSEYRIKYIQFGATDTEPRQEVQLALRRYAEHKFGIKIDDRSVW